MKKLKITLLILTSFVLLYFTLKLGRLALVPDDVSKIATEHFIISYHGIFKNEAEDVAEGLERHYDRIRTSLRDPEHEIIRVFVHPTQADFNEATGLINSTANGTSRGPHEFHFIWTTWFNSIFPDDPLKTAIHEFTHCVQLNILIKRALREFTTADEEAFNKFFEARFQNEYPQWLWEALCIYHANEVNTLRVKYGMSKNPTLESLNKGNQIYNVGYTLIEYIVERWSAEKLPEMITTHADFQRVLSVTQADFEKGWIDFVNERY